MRWNNAVHGSVCVRTWCGGTTLFTAASASQVLWLCAYGCRIIIIRTWRLQDAQLSQRDRAAGCGIVFAKSRRMELGDNILRTLYIYLQPLWYHRPENLSNSMKKTQNKGYYGVQSHLRSSRSVPIESPYTIYYYWHPISYRFRVIAAYCSNFAPTRSLWLKISGRRGRPPPINFARLVRPMNALQLCRWQFSHKETL